MTDYFTKCSRCGKTVKTSEWDNHVCKNLRSLNDIPTSILKELCERKITEDELWKKVFNKNK